MHEILMDGVWGRIVLQAGVCHLEIDETHSHTRILLPAAFAQDLRIALNRKD